MQNHRGTVVNVAGKRNARSRLRAVPVAGANPVLPGMLHSDRPVRTPRGVAGKTRQNPAPRRRTRTINVPPGTRIGTAPRRNPLNVAARKPGAKPLQRDLTRYYEDCIDTAPSKVQGNRRKSYCAGVAWKRARQSGKHKAYFRSNPTPAPSPAATPVRNNPSGEAEMKRNRKGQFMKGGGRHHKAKRRARRNPTAAAAPKRRAARRNPLPVAAAPAVKSNPTRRRRRRARVTAAAPRRRRARRNPWPGQPGRHRTAAKKGWETRRRGHATRTRAEKKQRRHRTSGYTIGRNETLIIRSNPMGMLGTVVGAIVMGGIGFSIADVIDRYIATRAPKATTANPTPKALTGAQAAIAIQHLNWGRVAIEAALAVAGVAGGLYLKKGMLRTAAISFGLGAGVKTGVDVISKALVPALFGGTRNSDGSLDLTADTTGNRLFADILQGSSQSDQLAKANPDVFTGLRGAPKGQAAGCGGGCNCDGTASCGCNDCKSRRMATDVWNRLQAQAPAMVQAQPQGVTPSMLQGVADPAPADDSFATVLNMRRSASR